MKKIVSVMFVLIFVFMSVSAQKRGLASINKTDLKASMLFFASDDLSGRETGSPENEVAALYLKTNLIRLGLKPFPGTDNYYQQIPLISKEITLTGTYLKINDKKGKAFYASDSLVYLMPVSKTMEAMGNIVFAGYGYTDTLSGYDDLKGVDLKDKIVLIMTGKPDFPEKFKGSPMFDPDLEEKKMGSVFRKGPKAILYVYNPANVFKDAYASKLKDMAAGTIGTRVMSLKDSADFSTPLQVAFITPRTADMLLKTTKNTLKQMQEKINKGKKPVSVEIPNIKVAFKTSIRTTELSCPNVIGIIEGSDRNLKNECVLYTAHFDHEGVNDEGEVYNGADDNASGSMALLEVAKAYMSLKKKPRRTIVFAWVNGEEKGLLGSQYYSNSPAIPMEKTLVDINLDMVGRSKMASDTGKFMGYDLTITQPGEILEYTSHESSELLNLVNASSKKAGISVIDKGADMEMGSSDHASFRAKGVPALLFISGVHADVHTINDDVDKIDFDKMEKVSKMVFILGYKVANQRARIKTDDQK